MPVNKRKIRGVRRVNTTEQKAKVFYDRGVEHANAVAGMYMRERSLQEVSLRSTEASSDYGFDYNDGRRNTYRATVRNYVEYHVDADYRDLTMVLSIVVGVSSNVDPAIHYEEYSQRVPYTEVAHRYRGCVGVNPHELLANVAEDIIDTAGATLFRVAVRKCYAPILAACIADMCVYTATQVIQRGADGVGMRIERDHAPPALYTHLRHRLLER